MSERDVVSEKSSVASCTAPSTPSGSNVPPVLCFHCQSPMKVDASFKATEVSGDKNEVENLTKTDVSGRPLNLLLLISDSQLPSDAPVCKECSDALRKGMEEQLKELEDDCIKYTNLITDLKTKHRNADLLEYRTTVEALKREEVKLMEELRELITQEEKMEAESAEVKKRLDAAREEEAQVWRRVRDGHSERVEGDNEVRAMNADIRYAQSRHKNLTRTSILNVVFPIDVCGEVSYGVRPPIARINGFRLGRLPDEAVDWPEINSAWGQAAFLLEVLVDRVAPSPTPAARIVPMSYSSYLHVVKDGRSRDVPLYACGSWRPFGNRNMDEGAALFLLTLSAVLDTIAMKARNAGSEVQWPHAIEHDKLMDGDMRYSVKMQFNGEERWTRAMIALLANLKWAAALVSAQF